MYVRTIFSHTQRHLVFVLTGTFSENHSRLYESHVVVELLTGWNLLLTHTTNFDLPVLIIFQ